MKQLNGDFTRVYVETGRKRVFAGAVDWPGWCRMGADEDAALLALLETGPRYAQVMQASQIPFTPPTGMDGFMVVEHLEGNATTDFGAPNIPPAGDSLPISEDEFLRLQALVMACWQAFDSAVISASGKDLQKGPRGEGRDLMGILEHLVSSDASDLSRISWKFTVRASHEPLEELGRVRQAILNALAKVCFDKIPATSAWKESQWTPRQFIRNLAWHTLDHAWEIEDRIV